MDFKAAREKSDHIVQYRCCKKTWWGGSRNNTCFTCKRTVEPLPLQKMIGVAWFKCPCNRIYAGFCRGNVTSECHGCHKKNLPLFIVPGDDASNPENKKKSYHSCSVCSGCGNCPIVQRARKSAGRR